MRVKLIGTGERYSVRVVDAETGKDVEGVTRASFVAEAGHDFPTLRLDIVRWDCDLEVDATVTEWEMRPKVIRRERAG